MSKIKVQQPVIHVPSFKEYKISNNDLALAIPHDRSRKSRQTKLGIPQYEKVWQDEILSQYEDEVKGGFNKGLQYSLEEFFVASIELSLQELGFTSMENLEATDIETLDRSGTDDYSNYYLV